MVSYGSLPPSGLPARPRRTKTVVVTGVAGAAVLLLAAMVVYHGSLETSELAQKAKWAYDWSGESVLVPKTAVNFKKGTRFSPSGEFENDAMDKAPMQQLAEQGKWAYDWSGGSVPVPQTAVNFHKGTRFSPSAEFENDAMDKARMVQLAQKKPQKWAYDWSGGSVPVPKTAVNYQKGTRFSQASEFENDAMDKAPTQELHWRGTWVKDYSGKSIPVPSLQVDYNAGTIVSPHSEFEHNAHDKARTVQLAQVKGKWAYDWSGESVPVPKTAVNFQKGTRFSPSGEFENDAMDKARMVQLAQKQNNMQIAHDYSNRPIPVPKTVVNFQAGTSAAPASPFENDAMDKARMVQLAQKKPQKWAYDWSGGSVPVPKTAVNYQKGTRFSQASEFENDAMDKAPTQELHWRGTWVKDYSGKSIPVPSLQVDYNAGTIVSPHSEFEHNAHDKAPTQQLASGDARDTRPMTERPTTCIGDLCADEVLDGMEDPQVDVKHAACDLDTDPDCQNSLEPLMDKQKKGSTLLAFSDKAARADMASFFAAEATRKHAAHKQAHTAPAHGDSAASADADLDQYFAQEAKLAAEPRVPHKRVMSEHKARAEAAPKHGMSGAAARKDAQRYFATQQQLVAEEEQEEAPEQTKASVHKIGEVPADETLDHPLWQSEDGTVDSVQVPQEKADCGDDIDCQSSRSPLLYKSKHTAGLSAKAADSELDRYFAQQAKLAATPQVQQKAAKPEVARPSAGPKYGLSAQAARSDVNRYFAAQKQQLAVYGVGALDDNAIEVGKAQGVDALLPETVFGENPVPPSDTIDEVNMAIQDQRNEGYTNGEAQPAEDIIIP